MTSRERVLTAIHHKPTDRVPADFWAEPPALNRLLAYVGSQRKDQLLDYLHVDVRHLETGTPPERHVTNGIMENFWGERFIYEITPWGPMRQDVKGALADATTFSAVESFPWPSPDFIDRSSLLEQCRRYPEHALLYGFADVWQRPALVRGWEEFFMDLVERPDWVHFICRKFTDFYLEDYTRAAELTHGRIDVFLLISDLGTQRGPLISHAMFAEFVQPYLKEMVEHIHRLGARVLFHSCGLIAPFVPDLIKIGIDVLDPIQPVAPAMQPESLQEQFGGHICFHGGIDMQELLPRGTSAQIQRQVRRYCEVLGANGGYILGPAHLFQPDVPPQNILALYQAPREA